ncbi:MAG: SAM-dependent methyltransferase, partial [Cytophagales bacterium CG18_big_fil_WC_8_21_14_2_50_42_9]
MPAHSFSPVAGFYDTLAHFVFGRNLQEAQAANLQSMADNIRILIIGGGTGWILQQVLQNTQNSSIVYLEASGSMLKKTEERIGQITLSNQIEYRLGTEADIKQAENFDLLITNFFLDLFSPVYLQSILNKLDDALAPDGKWLITDFVMPISGKLAHLRAMLLFKSMYLFFRLTCGISATTLPD